MALKPSLIKKLRARDPECWHCGDVEVVPHHRINRQMGGSKSRESDITNLMMICASWNGLVESDPSSAIRARSAGHKLRPWDETSTPVFHFGEQKWYVLNPDGTRSPVEGMGDDIPF